MVRLVKERGLGGLYTGFLASIAVSAPSSAVFAVGYEFSKSALESTPLHQFAPVLAAALGNVTASIVRVPPEVIKQRVQAAVYK
jgi:solute carrier family 25 S-adenosylmethionine transporter 26